MASRAARLRAGLSGRSAPLVGLAGLVALAIALLPLPYSTILVVGGAFGLLAFLQPTFGLAALALIVPFGNAVEAILGGLPAELAEWAIGALAVGWLARFAIRREKIHFGPLFWPIFVFIGTALLATSFAAQLAVALKVVIRFWVELLVVYVAANSLLRDESRRRIVLVSILAAGIGEGLLGAYQFFAVVGPTPFRFGSFLRAFGTFGQPNPYAGYLEMVLPLAVALVVLWRPRQRGLWVLALLAALVTGFAILMSLSRGSWLGIAAAVVVGASVATRRGWHVLLGAAVLGGLIFAVNSVGLLPTTIAQRLAQATDYFRIFDTRGVVPTDESFAVVERMAHWQAGWEMFLDNILTGVGPGHFELAYSRYAILPFWKDPLGHAHNIYINTAAETGLLGLLSYLAMVGSWLYLATTRAFRFGQRDRAGLSYAIAVGVLGSLVAVTVHSAFDNLYVHMLTSQIGLLLGLVASTDSEEVESPTAL